jgi:hypothetical protein
MLIDTPSFIAPVIGAPRNFPTPRPTQAPRPTARAVFELVIEQFKARGLSRGESIREAVKAHPDLHQRWLAEINTP